MKRLITLPDTCNYIGAFVTLRCNLGCSYCINNVHNKTAGLYKQELPASQWIRIINRIPAREDLPITLQGGEPTLNFKRFVDIVMGTDKPMDLLTNLSFNMFDFMDAIPASRFKRNAPYASIRVSFHPETMDMFQTINNVVLLRDNGYQIGVWMVDHPSLAGQVDFIARAFLKEKIDFRLKEFLGYYNGKLYGTYLYPEAIDGVKKHASCQTTELLIGPDGFNYACHADLYAKRNRRTDMNLVFSKPNIGETVVCRNCGVCNPCDIKVKTNRFQEYGHTTVKIKTAHKRSKRWTGGPHGYHGF